MLPIKDNNLFILETEMSFFTLSDILKFYELDNKNIVLFIEDKYDLKRFDSVGKSVLIDTNNFDSVVESNLFRADMIFFIMSDFNISDYKKIINNLRKLTDLPISFVEHINSTNKRMFNETQLENKLNYFECVYLLNYNVFSSSRNNSVSVGEKGRFKNLKENRDWENVSDFKQRVIRDIKIRKILGDLD